MNKIPVIFVIIINIIYAERPADIRQNKISNSCNFDIINIKRQDVTCFDYGKNKAYCNHYALVNEFTITKEKYLNKDTIIIKPEAMYEEFSNNKNKIAKFYFSFVCHNYENKPKLELNIVPTSKYDKSLYQEFTELIIFIVVIIYITLIVIIICPTLDNNNEFISDLVIDNNLNPIINNNLNTNINNDYKNSIHIE